MYWSFNMLHHISFSFDHAKLNGHSLQKRCHSCWVEINLSILNKNLTISHDNKLNKNYFNNKLNLTQIRLREGFGDKMGISMVGNAGGGPK